MKRGPGYWKFNNKLLHDKAYVELVKSEIEIIKAEEYKIENKNTFWDYVKCRIRTVTITYAIKKAKAVRENELKVKAQLDNLEKELIISPGTSEEYFKIKAEWEELEKCKADGAIFRSKVKWIEEGERNTKYFINLEKQNYNIKYIKALIDSNGTLITDASSIINEQRKFYKNLYTTKQGSSIDEELDLTEFLQVNTSKLKAMEKQICENDLKIDEVANALKQLPNDKSPGSDGFTTNFYKFFWPDIKDFLHESFLYSFKNGELTNDQKRGIINLIPKEGKDLRYLRNWTPLSLLNTDYKILTKTLSNRLQKVLPKLVNEDQVGYIKGRYIGQNIRIIKDIMTYTGKKNLPGYILLIDFEKAFHSIEWPFLIKCLKLYNFGEILYAGFSSYIKILNLV